ncbi:hypothetical protein N0V86_001814 [Didymella sp. IMI 355093]|nr:hypothetical protein N0V86_001814 [Didymella sp. IMI 355093]
MTCKDSGLKVLREAPAAAESIDVVAVHGLGAHPDDSWCKNAGTAEEPRWRNWLIEDDMLPAVAPNARIMRYGYESQWFGKEAMQQSASIVADRLLRALKRKRKALLEAEQYPKEWPGIFSSTTGLVFFGTPFRGAEGMNQMEMLEAARREYHDDQVQPTVLEVLQPGNAYLQDLVDGFLKKLRGQANKIRVVCFFELKSSNVGRIVGKQDRIRFVVSQHAGCLDLSESTDKRSLSRTHFDMNKFEDAEEEDFEIVAEVIQSMVEASSELLRARSQYAGRHEVDFSLRGVPEIGRFVPRNAEMQQLEKILLNTQRAAGRRNVAAVHGLGGIGKTQLAVEFARKHKGSFSGVFWLDGSSETSVKQSLADTALRLPRDELTTEGAAVTDVNMAMRECLRWLSLPSNHNWLLIIDNVDRDYCDQGDLQAYNVKKYFPQADHGSILITSRLLGLGEFGAEVKVGTVGPEQARAILENNAGKRIEDAATVLDLLCGFPLALTQAGAYMREANVSASEYAQHYNQTWGRLMKKQERHPLESYGERSVLTTWTVSYEQVQRQSKAAAWLLKLWGYLDNGELWYELIAAGKGLAEETDLPRWLCELAEDKLEFGEAARLLCRYSLADATAESGSFSMHAVMHRWCGQLAEGQEQQELYHMAAELGGKKAWGEEHESTLNTANNLGLLYADLGLYKEAEKMYKQALNGKEKAWGEEHVSTLNTVNNLANLYKTIGRHKEAEKMYKQALNGKEKAWGEEHTSTLNTVNNLGLLFADLGQYEKAEALLGRALAGYKNIWGEEHTSTLETVNNLGLSYAGLGRYKEAEALLCRALEGFNEALGPEHASTLETVNNLGFLYADFGRHEKAEALLSRALEGFNKALGPEHLSTLETVSSLGKLYTQSGNYEKAKEMLEGALEGFEKVVGLEQISVYVPALDVMEVIATLCDSQGCVDDARMWFEKTLSGYEKVFGREDLRCQSLHAKLAALGGPEKDSKVKVQAAPVQEQVHNQNVAASHWQQLGSWSVGLGYAGLEHWECFKRHFSPNHEALDTLD